jgi:hypothetical protein
MDNLLRIIGSEAVSNEQEIASRRLTMTLSYGVPVFVGQGV